MEVGAPVRIVSTYRPDACNRSVGGRFSQHLYCNAVDFVIGSRAARDKFMSEIEGKGCIYRTLVAMGIRGIGPIHSTTACTSIPGIRLKYPSGVHSIQLP